MDCVVGKTYFVEVEGADGEIIYLGDQLIYVGESTLQMSDQQVHVFQTPSGSLLEVRDQDVADWRPT
jgi:hypothetical protein